MLLNYKHNIFEVVESKPDSRLLKSQNTRQLDMDSTDETIFNSADCPITFGVTSFEDLCNLIYNIFKT